MQQKEAQTESGDTSSFHLTPMKPDEKDLSQQNGPSSKKVTSSQTNKEGDFTDTINQPYGPNRDAQGNRIPASG